MKALILLTAHLALLCGDSFATEKPRPNILLIVLDDQNAFAGRTDLAPEPVTPNLDRLAERGVTFANAQCAAPVCNPSRTAMLSGLRPSTTGIYDNDQDTIPADHLLRRRKSLPAYFQEHGYVTAGGGKIFGSSIGTIVKREGVWDVPLEGARHKRTDDARPPKDRLPLSGLAGKHDWGAFPASREQMSDWQMAGHAAEFLARAQDQPFFLACGIVKPHTPWYVPQKYFDLFPPDRVQIPALADDESAGLPEIVRVKPRIVAKQKELVARRKEMVAAYLATSRFADDCLGRILDALEKSSFRDNTIVIVCGDNGYQFGEKHNWSKGRLWEGSAHVPLVIAGPGVERGKTSTRPVSLLDLYPTLLESAGLPRDTALEGTSIVPLLRDAAAPWDRTALTTSGFKNHALRTERWRYIRYADGAEELYDHNDDPLERTNLASKPEFAAIKIDLQKWLPQHDEPRNPDTAGGKNADD